MVEPEGIILLDGGPSWEEACQLAGAFLAGFQSPETRRGYRSDLRCWFDFCRTRNLHPFREIRRIHLELYLRELESTGPRPANATLYRRISTLSSWFRWLEEEEFNVGNPAARMRRPTRHPTPQPWLDRNQLTDLLAAAEDEGGDAYAMTCLLALNGPAGLRGLQRQRHRPRWEPLPAHASDPRQGRQARRDRAQPANLAGNR